MLTLVSTSAAAGAVATAPGWPRMNRPGLVTKSARSQASGFRHTTSPIAGDARPACPPVGVPLPATNG